MEERDRIRTRGLERRGEVHNLESPEDLGRNLMERGKGYHHPEQ